jgi:phosphatidylglycerol:prolipoprotein diacylglycerol transferase
MLLAVNFPSWLKPEIIPGLPLRWYGLMYIFAFATAFLLYRRQIRERNFPMTEDQLSGMFTWCILGLLLGARIFATIVYETSDIYREKPWLVFWPFRDGRFTGLMGMSYHGGAIGGLLGILIYSAVKRFDWREIGDMFAASIPLGYTFGRLGNFINGELYGRVTSGPLGMIFPHARPLPASEAWVREAAEQSGISIPFSGLVNLPRYPSQLYEAFFEGIVLWAIIWLLRNRKPFKGFLLGIYLIGYGLFRFLIEYFREPDEDLGYRIELIQNTLPQALAHPPLSFSTGQLLSLAMILLGLIWLLVAPRLPNREAVIHFPDAPEPPTPDPDGDPDRNRRRKLRKKLK